MLEHGDVVSDAQNHAGRRGVLGDEAGNPRVLAHEPRKARMRVVKARRFCNFQKPARCVLHKQRAGHFPILGGGGPSLKLSFFSSSSWIRFASISARIRLAS